MNDKSTAIIATIAAILFCGCPGLFLCLFGGITATGNGSFNNTSLSPVVGIALVCLSLILILIPVVVGFFTMRKKPQSSIPNEPLPPAS